MSKKRRKSSNNTSNGVNKAAASNKAALSDKGPRATSKTKSKEEGLVVNILNRITAIYVCALLVIFPVYMEKKYLNMGDAKYHFFLYVSILMLGILIAFWIQYILMRKDELMKTRHNWYKALSSTDWCVLAFGLLSIISCIFAHNKDYAVWGFSGWNMGLVSQIIFVLIFLFVSRYYKWNPTILQCAIVVGGIVYLIAVLQRFDLDIFRLYWNANDEGVLVKLDDIYVEKFVSTLGQTSWYSSYAILILPFGMYWYIVARKKMVRVLTGLFIVLGAASLCTVNNDSAYISIAVIMLVFFCYSFNSNEWMIRFFEIIIMFFGTFRLIGLLQNMFPERMINLISGDEKITQFVNHSGIMLIGLVAMIVIYIVLRLADRMNGNKANNTNKTNNTDNVKKFDVGRFSILGEIVTWLFIIAVWAVVLLMILATKGKLPQGLAGLYNIGFFNFDDNWGNYRGFNWRMAVRAFDAAGIKDKLIGVGPDSFAWSMNAYFKDEVSEFWHGLQLACAHNEWLNMLVTEGIFGVAAYLGIFITSAIRLGKNAEHNPVAVPCMAAVLAYMSFNFFCYQTCLCTPYIFMIMGMGEMMIRNKESKFDNN